MPVKMKWWHVWKYPKLFKAIKKAWNELFGAFKNIVKKIKEAKQ
jgi:hypothetical protein